MGGANFVEFVVVPTMPEALLEGIFGDMMAIRLWEANLIFRRSTSFVELPQPGANLGT